MVNDKLEEYEKRLRQPNEILIELNKAIAEDDLQVLEALHKKINPEVAAAAPTFEKR